MGPEFFQTGMGRSFFEGTMPRIAKALERIADALEKQNDPRREARELEAREDHEVQIYNAQAREDARAKAEGRAPRLITRVEDIEP